MDDFDSIVLPAHANPIVITWLKQGKLKIMPSGCWEWQKYRSLGYGRVWHAMKVRNAHRIAINAPDDLQSLHACDNPPCCNPSHLSLGTDQDNRTDAMNKGRLLKPYMNKNKRCECGRSVSGNARKCLTCQGVGRTCKICLETGRNMHGLICLRCKNIKDRKKS